ncbi:predicted protein [Histoplasma mississippiense (nom. inval.)]|uniref:predicted protein n=1 Tax=Ajellomyces capsulatus (strain NAm1 / WU24) TaxID=2059318 RepID=UPI000157C18D|nr:predicted protein [Histoplasma mississippiense (nom. inval.)]EDN07347.1 predicted protein [Histoplasma mississippiense (nom. inval.)]
MAPIYKPSLQIRQTHVLPPRPANGPLGGAMPVSSSFRWKTLLWLMIATFCIFILTVYIWKFGAFLRHFTRHRILDGNPKSTRYAKTWHGWVPLDDHETKRARRQKRFKKFRRSVAWKSPHADYNWVWWDPKGAAVKQHFEDQKGIRWLRRWLKNHEHRKGELISKAHARGRGSGEPDANKMRKPGLRHSMKISSQVVKFRKRPLRSRLPLFLDGHSDNMIPSILYNSLTRISAKKAPPYLALNSRTTSRQKPTLDLPHTESRRCTSLSHLPPSLGIADIRFAPEVRRKAVSEALQGNAIPSTLFPTLYDARLRRFIPSGEGQNDPMGPQTAVTAEKSLSWKYKAWAAKMEIHTFGQSPPCLHGLIGRPGSPLSAILKSMSSSGHYSEFSDHYNHMPTHKHDCKSVAAGINPSGPSAMSQLAPRIQRRAPPRVHVSATSDASLDTASVDGNMDVGRSLLAQNINQIKGHVQQQPLLSQAEAETSARRPLHPMQNKAISFQLPKNPQNPRKESWESTRARLSDYEIQLIYDLDCRLEWLSSEVEPGRKPFHFLLLANHWLNRATWIVLDPVSRVPPAERRTYGDPRFNRPFTEPRGDAVKQNYPVQGLVKLDAPRLDSWRMAINGARKSTGAKEFLKAAELFDGSVDETPNSSFDPASWILRKPPQGYERSKKQGEVYYEGMGGWWEKLEDWQNVCRGYRARKIICEGGANRRRIREVARKATGPYRKVVKRWNQGPSAHLKAKRREEQPAASEMRQIMSGSGSIPRQRSRRHDDSHRRPTIAGLAVGTSGNICLSVSRSTGGFSGESAHNHPSMEGSCAVDGSCMSATAVETFGSMDTLLLWDSHIQQHKIEVGIWEKPNKDHHNIKFDRLLLYVLN